MDAETQREIQKLRDEVTGLRGRMKLLTSNAGGHVSGQLNFAGWLQLEERAAPGTPATGKIRVYHKSGGGLVFIDSNGAELEFDSGRLTLTGSSGRDLFLENGTMILPERSASASPASDEIKVYHRTAEGLVFQDGADGSEIMFDEGHVKMDAFRDIYPDVDGVGLFRRLVNRSGIAGYTDHFRSGTIPDGFAWVSTTGFDGTPSVLTYSHYGDYLSVAPSSGPTKHFLARTVSDVSQRVMAGRFLGSRHAQMGFRFDDGTDDNYVELYVAPYSQATFGCCYKIELVLRQGGGAPSTNTAGPIYAIDQVCHFRLVNYDVGSIFYVAHLLESGMWTGSALDSAGGISFTVSRVGIVVSGTPGFNAQCDWFYHNFS